MPFPTRRTGAIAVVLAAAASFALARMMREAPLAAAGLDAPLDCATTVETAATAAPARALLPASRIVSFYGNPRSARMGILGALPPDTLLDRLRAQAAEYAAADPATPVIPALHLVTVVAQKDAGADGLHRGRMPAALVDEVASWIDPDSMLLFLDIQPGGSSMVAEARNYVAFLERPWVHLALDPEFAMTRGETPGSRIGGIDAEDVNAVIDLLAGLVERLGLPPKILIVHRFTDRMLTGAARIRLDPRVQVVITMDGFGGPELKEDAYRCVVAAQPVEYTGFKLFYRQDAPLMSPARVLALRPAPHVIIYQ